MEYFLELNVHQSHREVIDYAEINFYTHLMECIHMMFQF